MSFDELFNSLVFLIIVIMWLVGIFSTMKRLPKTPLPQKKKRTFEDYSETIEYKKPETESFKKIPETPEPVESILKAEETLLASSLIEEEIKEQRLYKEPEKLIYRLDLTQKKLKEGILLSIILGPPKAKEPFSFYRKG
ncbi:MAG: hypothetical protein FJZ16_01280 [Candidatus Omnitrophica bacterium]|nr:hypothetical protein [Candidatus Omnitrophota bacterium]